MSVRLVNGRTGRVEVCSSVNWVACRHHNVKDGWSVYAPAPVKDAFKDASSVVNSVMNYNAYDNYEDNVVNIGDGLFRMDVPVPQYEAYFANKGEHSEMVFSLWLLKSGRMLDFGHILLDYKDDVLSVVDSRSGKVLNNVHVDADSLDRIVNASVGEISSSKGVFESSVLSRFYDLFKHYGVEVKASSGRKSDVIVVERDGLLKRREGLSVKSFLGSNPSLLNANGLWSGLEFKAAGLSDSDVKKCLDDPCKVESSVLDKLVFVKYCDEGFRKLVGGYTSLPEVLLKWKKGGGNKLSGLTSVAQRVEGEKFILRVMQGLQDGKPSRVGVVNSDGNISVHPLSKLWEGAYFDSPSRSRHDYGYFYMKNSELHIRLTVAVRLSEAPFK